MSHRLAGLIAAVAIYSPVAIIALAGDGGLRTDLLLLGLGFLTIPTLLLYRLLITLLAPSDQR